MRNLLVLLILIGLLSCAPERVFRTERYTPGTVEGTVVKVAGDDLQVRRFKDNQVVTVRVRTTEGIYIGDRVKVTDGEVRKTAAKGTKR
ncbi:MAG: hypothetical protein ACM3ON_08050 [Chloroflexota bacterium]